MRILLDACVPRGLQQYLPEHVVRTDLPVDSEAPHDVTITTPAVLDSGLAVVGVVGLHDGGAVEVAGTVVDESSVPSIEIEIVGAAGVRRVACIDQTPRDGRWSCSWTPDDTRHNARYTLRARATDTHGLTGLVGAA